ncbi:hypothetical protein [Blastococcus sp. CT_GayMR19]|uniref:hypothetical protein n=1 Tax=Blastococcus sp. CT_GayMR19 TaxID=2559608 RepID=UPI00143120D8|nr:hypothetical protein [Blastococcus sp. CT_GayMR19]
MTTAADDSAVEDAFEAILAGRPVPERAAGLAAFTGAVRASATTPGRPHAALAELLATGLLTDQSSPSVRTATSAGSVPARRSSRVRTRRRPAMIISALFVKFLSAGAVAQAATGATVAVVAFTGVGAVGALPDPVQDTFATVVADITPIEPPTSGETTGDVVPEEPLPEAIPVAAPEDAETGTTEGTGAAEEAEFDVAAWAVAGPEGYDSFGAWLTEGTHKEELKAVLQAKGMGLGDVVSGLRNGKGIDKEVLAALGVEIDDPAAAPAEPEPVVDEAVAPQPEVAATQDSGPRKDKSNGNNGNGSKRGNGNGNGNGNGKN